MASIWAVKFLSTSGFVVLSFGRRAGGRGRGEDYELGRSGLFSLVISECAGGGHRRGMSRVDGEGRLQDDQSCKFCPVALINQRYH